MKTRLGTFSNKWERMAFISALLESKQNIPTVDEKAFTPRNAARVRGSFGWQL